MDSKTFHDNFDKLANRARQFAPFAAEDLVQETFLRILKTGLPQPWSLALLHHTLTWVMLDHYRKIRKTAPVPLFDVPVQPTMEDAILARQLLDSDPHGWIVERSVIGGASPLDLAAETGLSANTIAVRKHRALGRMRDLAMRA